MTFGITAGMVTAAAAVAGAGAAVYGATQKGSSAGTATTTQQQTLNPNVSGLLYGSNGNTGVMQNLANLGSAPQNAGANSYGMYADGTVGSTEFKGETNSNLYGAQNISHSNIAAPTAQAAQIQAPSQNGINLTPAYNQMINGNAGANPYLTSALQSAVNQTNASYANNQTSLTNNLQRNILPGIDDGAVLSGQYGGTRQGIAQGNALSDYTNQLTNTNLQLGLANSANTTGQQAQAYNQGQDRSLSAMNTLGGQQYSTASQNAQMQQQANLANQNSQVSTNALNSANQIQGTQLSQGLLNNMYSQAGSQDQYGLNKASAAAGAISPFTGLGATNTTAQPLYSNVAGNLIGGATAGLGLLNAYNKANQSTIPTSTTQTLDSNGYPVGIPSV